MDPVDIQAEFSRALDALRVARLFYGDGLYEDAVLWSYTAVVHAARSVLLLHEQRVTTHARLRRACAALLVRPGRLDKAILYALIRVQDCRIALDLNAYGPLFLTAEQVSPVMSDAVQFVRGMRCYLHHAGIDVTPSDPHTQCSDGSILFVTHGISAPVP